MTNENGLSRPWPAYLSSPFQVLFWETDELLMIVMGLVIALLSDALWTWSLVIIIPVIYCRIKKDRPKGYLYHLLYFAGFIKMEGYPLYFDNTFQD
ncbi:type IV conjugative transfer system protein TraL [Geoalkalibacter sp.]|uniref:type IV conjugative transfer system protein TraL n=1 Tax=Geoalkalibacter sp. TaxID=3041440 RepID=UPI00272E6900|nr:type IV conjugative transfer system protein TraL [Geoalkalibacter sp.]